jgi:hypothetical protein
MHTALKDATIRVSFRIFRSDGDSVPVTNHACNKPQPTPSGLRDLLSSMFNRAADSILFMNTIPSS